MTCVLGVHLRTGPDINVFGILRTFFASFWFRKKSKYVQLAAKRHELSRRHKHAGNLANGLRCSPLRRAEYQENSIIFPGAQIQKP
jgi:hypothetical protein